MISSLIKVFTPTYLRIGGSRTLDNIKPDDCFKFESSKKFIPEGWRELLRHCSRLEKGSEPSRCKDFANIRG